MLVNRNWLQAQHYGVSGTGRKSYTVFEIIMRLEGPNILALVAINFINILVTILSFLFLSLKISVTSCLVLPSHSFPSYISSKLIPIFFVRKLGRMLGKPISPLLLLQLRYHPISIFAYRPVNMLLQMHTHMQLQG